MGLLRPKVPGQETPEQCSFHLVPQFKEYSQGIVTMNPESSFLRIKKKNYINFSQEHIHFEKKINKKIK